MTAFLEKTYPTILASLLGVYIIFFHKDFVNSIEPYYFLTSIIFMIIGFWSSVLFKLYDETKAFYLLRKYGKKNLLKWYIWDIILNGFVIFSLNIIFVYTSSHILSFVILFFVLESFFLSIRMFNLMFKLQ